MIIMNKIQKKDINEFANSFELSDLLVNSSFLVTGATGLIGSTLVHCLLAYRYYLPSKKSWQSQGYVWRRG